jgi:serine O-acetyltransferase
MRESDHARFHRTARAAGGEMTPVRLWRLSTALRNRGLIRTSELVKKLNSALYHNSLAPGATVSPDLKFGHHGFGTMIHSNVVIGKKVKIWHNVTIAVRASVKSPHRIIIEDDVRIGANSVIISPYEASLRIGRGARIGAGAVVSRDIPAGATVVSPPPRVLLDDGSEECEQTPAPLTPAQAVAPGETPPANPDPPG